MVCFTILGGHDALKDDKQSPAKVMPLSSGMPTYDASWCRHPTLTCPPRTEHLAREWYPLMMRTDVVISPSPALPWGAEMLCFTMVW